MKTTIIATMVLAEIAMPKQAEADDWWDTTIGGFAAGAFISNYYSPRPYHGYNYKYGQYYKGSHRYNDGDPQQKHPYGANYKHWTEF